LLLLDPTQRGVAEEIHRVLQASYQVEGRLLGIEDFPPLRRTVAEIRRATTTFHGIRVEKDLAAVAELEATSEESAHINAFVVHPRFFRRGLGRALLLSLQGLPRSARLTVSTAAANEPALALYALSGFHKERDWEQPFGLAMVTLTWRKGSMPA